jgi:hypothetical protein
MKLSTAVSAGVFALACWTFPDLAQAPSQVAPPATAPHSGEFPGTLDPATKIFTPLGPGAAAPAPRVRGTLGLTVVIIGVDNDFGTPFTLLIHWICEFGRVVVPRDVVNGKVVNQIFVPD